MALAATLLHFKIQGLTVQLTLPPARLKRGAVQAGATGLVLGHLCTVAHIVERAVLALVSRRIIRQFARWLTRKDHALGFIHKHLRFLRIVISDNAR